MTDVEDDWGPLVKHVDDEDLRLGYSFMRALAEEGQVAEIGPGVWSTNAEGTTWVPTQMM